jgi:hypothetical protein
MRKAICLPVAAVVGGLVGLAVRQSYLSSAFDPGSGVYLKGTPAAYGLGIVMLVVAVLLVWLSQGKHRTFAGEYHKAFALDHQVPLVGILASVFLFAAAGVLNLHAFLTSPINVITGTKELSFLYALLGIFCLLTAASLFLMAKRIRAGKEPPAPLTLIPGYTACIWTMVNYQAWAQKPVIQSYMFLLLAVLLSMVGCCLMASFCYGKGPVTVTLLVCSLGGSACLLLLGDGMPLYTTILCLALAFYQLSMVLALGLNDAKPAPAAPVFQCPSAAAACAPEACASCPGCAPQSGETVPPAEGKEEPQQENS